jgi:EAL domain-containing protein (putative c-di-GMP-specific phosphodiesterase class I)/GGDEF domain-containing protein
METEPGASSTCDGEGLSTESEAPERANRRTALPRRRRSEDADRTGSDDVMRDAATGLVPRATFVARLQDQLGRGLAVGLVALGVDWMDGPGSPTLADPTLVSTVAKRITAGLRSSDLVASFGGDGFVVLLADVPAPEVLHAIARRLVAAASGPVSLMGRRIEGRATAAYAMPASGELRADQLLALAIRARQRARTIGGDRVLAFDPSSADAPAPAVTWPIEELERALQAGEFEAWFQPVVEVATADLAGFEALLRWVHPELGVLTPPQFLQAAEDAGLLCRISTEVMRQALRHLARWDARVSGRPLTMGVNLSARHLDGADLSDTIGDLVAASGLPADRLRIDVSERTLTADPDVVAVHVTSLRRLGVRVCLDDFGAGSASMVLLQRIPFDVIKLDRSLLDSADTDTGRTVLEAIVGFGHSVGALVLAENVESPRELSALRRARADQAQGRLFSGARAARDIDSMLDRWLGQPSVAAAPAAS